MNDYQLIPFGYCHCGCGQKTPIAKVTVAARQWFKGKPKPYIPCHSMRKPLEIRFWEKVRRSPDGCWNWTGSTKGNGYGQFSVNNKPRWAHRLAYELANGPITDGLLVCHRCDNRLCVRPSHMFLGTPKDNARDMSAKGRLNPKSLLNLAPRFVKREKVIAA